MGWGIDVYFSRIWCRCAAEVDFTLDLANPLHSYERPKSGHCLVHQPFMLLFMIVEIPASTMPHYYH